MNIFIREMKAHRKSLIIWCVAMVFTVISGMAKFATFSSSGQSFNEIFSQMPQSLRALLGLSTFDLSKVSGYYGVLFVYILLMATIHSSMLGANIISKEERDKTAEFLMTKPVSRNKIVTAKLGAALINIVIFNLVTLVSSIVVASNYNSKGEPINHYIIMIMTGMFIVQILFLSLGTVIAAKSKSSKLPATISTLIIVATYLLSVIIDINSKLEGLKFLTPFKYFNSYDLMYGNGFSIGFLLLATVLITGFSTLTYVFYMKRDLSI